MLSLALNLAGNGRTGLWDRDEPRYAVCVREMRARGDWIFPTFNGEPRYHKPILIYWLMGLATALGGDNPFGVRLVSSVAGAATVLGVWWLGRRMFGPRGGRLAALIMATAPIAVAESKLATTDATLALWLFGCQACLWVLGRRPSHTAAALFWVFLSLATLTKGPIGPALIAAASLLPGGGAGRPSAWKRLHWRRGLIGFAILTAPWFVLISLASAGEFLRFAVGRQIVHRLASDMEAHGGFPGYYPVVSALVFYPWSALVPAAVVGAWMRRKSDPNLGFLLGWAIGPLLLLECFRTKLIHYYLPAIPRMRPADGLAGPVGDRRGREHQAQAARPPGDGAPGRDRPRRHRRSWSRATTRGAGIAPTSHAPGRRGHGGRHARRPVGLSARSNRRAVYSLAATLGLVMLITSPAG